MLCYYLLQQFSFLFNMSLLILLSLVIFLNKRDFIAIFFQKVFFSHYDRLYSHLSKVFRNVKNPYIINQNHIFSKNFWIDFNKRYTKTFGIVNILIVYLLIMLL